SWLGITPWQHSVVGDHVTPTSGRTLSQKIIQHNYFPRRADRSTRLAARQKTNQAGVDPGQRDAQRAARRLAIALIDQIPFLFGEKPGRITPLLSRFATGPLAWTAHDVHTHITRTDTRHNR